MHVMRGNEQIFFICIQMMMILFVVDKIVCFRFFSQYLQALKPSYDEEDREDGKKPENKDKNNDLKILPGIHLCLTLHVCLCMLIKIWEIHVWILTLEYKII